MLLSLKRRVHERGQQLGALTLRRALAALVLVPLVTLVTFALAGLSPLDPLVAYLGDSYEHTTHAERDAARESLGLDRPWWGIWTQWAGQALRGDFGISHAFKQPVTTVFAQRLPWTIGLSALGLLLAIAMTLFAGWVIARRPGGRTDRAVARFAIIASAVPSFVFSLLLVTLFAVSLRWFPVGGAYEPGESPTLGGVAYHIVLPAIALALSQAPWMIMTLRESIHEALASAPVQAARTRGLSERTILRGHVAPVSANALIAFLGSRFAEVIAGALVVEEVFSWPGIAGATVQAALTADFALIAAIATATSVLMIIGTWLADCLLILTDPRVQVER